MKSMLSHGFHSVIVWLFYYTTPLVATRQRFELQLMYYPFNCNQIVVRVAIDVHSELQILSVFPWYCTTSLVETDGGSCCNQCTLRVANNECFCLIPYYPFNCYRTSFRVAIDVHSEFQIMNTSAWYCTTPSVATRQWFELQSMYTPSCKYWVLPFDIILPI
jgi:hypothetical protein